MFDWLRLVGMSLNAGVRSAIATYKNGAARSPSGDSLISPVMGGDWESYESRLWRYFHYDLYYFNQVFTNLEKYSKEHLRTEGLYKYTRGLYNPVFRLVNITASKCYGGPLDMETLTTGAIPLAGLDRYTEDALRQLFKWSNFGQIKMRYARNTARYGDGVLKVVDDPVKGHVRIEVLHPGVVREAEIDAVGHVKKVIIEYERLDPLGTQQGETCLYREVIDQEQFATYRIKNEKADLYPWQTDVNGNPVSEWGNIYGFVPVAMAQAADVGRKWGAVTYHGGAMRKVDQLNDLASLTFDHIRQAVDVMWYAAGADSIDDIDQSGANPAATPDEEIDQANADRETVPIITGPEGSSITAMVASLDFTGALQAIESLQLELEKDYGELAFAKLREYQQNSAPAVKTVLGDAIDRLTEFNSNLDAPLTRAMQMACTIGGLGNYQNFERFGIDSYDSGALDFSIKPRNIVLDELSKFERLNMYKDTEAPPRWIWLELGKTEEEVAEGEAYVEGQSMAVAGQVGRALAAAQTNQNQQQNLLTSGQQQSGNGNGEEDEDQDEEQL